MAENLEEMKLLLSFIQRTSSPRETMRARVGSICSTGLECTQPDNVLY